MNCSISLTFTCCGMRSIIQSSVVADRCNHDPQPDSQLAYHGHACLAQTFLHQFAPVETLELRIATHRMRAGLTPEKAQQWTALFGDLTELLSSAGVFPRDDPHILARALPSPKRFGSPRNTSVAITNTFAKPARENSRWF
jgi:hypothetical protein